MFCSTNFTVEKIWWHFCSVIWGQEMKLRTQNLDILSFKGTFHTNFDSEWGNESFVQQISP
jgi:hypothetical protein